MQADHNGEEKEPDTKAAKKAAKKAEKGVELSCIHVFVLLPCGQFLRRLVVLAFILVSCAKSCVVYRVGCCYALGQRQGRGDREEGQNEVR